jgi:alpha-tubulin suppressor-like RCC1 family protein
MLPASIEDRSPSPEAAAETLPPLSLASSETMLEAPTVEARRRTVLLTWGLNSSGQLGFGDFSTRILPRAVDYFKATRMAGVVCGSRTTFVLDAEGKVFSFGKGEDGALGSGDRATAMTPRLIESLQRQPIAQIKCRGAHVLALTARGQLWAWGRDEDGQLGSTKTASGKPREHHHSIPERVSDLMGTRVLHVACGRCHSIAVDSNGRLFSWGGNDDGALGHGDRLSRATPTACAALEGMVVVGVACGSRHTLALVRDVPMLEGGKERALDGGQSAHGGACVYSWGWGVYGQLGHGDVVSRLESLSIACEPFGVPFDCMRAVWSPFRLHASRLESLSIACECSPRCHPLPHRRAVWSRAASRRSQNSQLGNWRVATVTRWLCPMTNRERCLHGDGATMGSWVRVACAMRCCPKSSPVCRRRDVSSCG